MPRSHNSEDHKTSITDYKINRSIQCKGHCCYGGIRGDYDYVGQVMLAFMTSINISFLPKGSIISISKTIWYEKYSILLEMVKIQAPH